MYRGCMSRRAGFAVVIASMCVTLFVGCHANGCPAGGVRTTVLPLPSPAAANEAGKSAASDAAPTVPAGPVRLVTVVAGAGTLHITGGSTELSATGNVCAPDSETAAQVELLSYIKEDSAYVEAAFPFTLAGSHSTLNLRVRMPKQLPVSVINKSGNVDIERVASVSMADLGGNLAIRNIAGSVTITRSSTGNVLIQDISGTAAVQQDLGGKLTVKGVGGNVVLQRTDTVDIAISNVQGDVVIWNDGPGDIDVRNVRGDLFVQADHGGKLTYHGIQGTVHLPEPGGF